MSNRTTTEVLVLEFTTFDNKARSLRIMDPKQDLNAQQVQEVMELIVETNAFQAISLMGPPKLKGAKTVTTTQSKFAITVE